jgi:hypothetical protein
MKKKHITFKIGLVDRFFFGTSLLNRFLFRNRFIGTGFYLGNRFMANKKNINIRSKIKVKFKVFYWEN